MAEYRLNKSELTRLQRELTIYGQYLPVLKLKKEQLQSEHGRLKRAYLAQKEKVAQLKTWAEGFVALLAEPLPFDVVTLVRPLHTEISERVVAGVRVPHLEEVQFSNFVPPRFGSPAWLSRALPELRRLAEENLRGAVMEQQYHAVDRELRKTTQKVNLFEKVLVPRTREAIKRIRITLGDRQVASVCRAKIAKSKKQQLEETAS